MARPTSGYLGIMARFLLIFRSTTLRSLRGRFFPILLLLLAAAPEGSAQIPSAPIEQVAVGRDLVIQDLTQTQDGLIWLGTTDGLYSYDGLNLTSHDDLLPVLEGRSITALVPDRYPGYLWIGTADFGLYRFNGHSTVPVAAPNGLGTIWPVVSLHLDTEDNLWIGTPNDLLWLRGAATAARLGLPGVKAQAVVADPFENIWVAVGSSVFRRTQGVFQPIDLPLALPSAVIYDLAMLDGILFVARSDGLLRLGGEYERLGLPQTFEYVPQIPDPSSLAVIGEELWIGTRENGLWHRNADDQWARLDPRSEDTEALQAVAFAGGRHGELWIGTRNGLWRRPVESDAVRGLTPRILKASLHRSGGDGSPQKVSLGAHRSWSLAKDVEGAVLELGSIPGSSSARFRYRVGNDGPWIELDDHSLSLPNLAAGTFSLAIQAREGDGPWGPVLEQDIGKVSRFQDSGGLLLWLGGGGALLFAGLLGSALMRRRRPHDPYVYQDPNDEQDESRDWLLEDMTPDQVRGESATSEAAPTKNHATPEPSAETAPPARGRGKKKKKGRRGKRQGG